MAIEVKEVPIKTHNNVGKMKWYHAPLYCAYKIISLELKDASEELTLQIAVKAVNDSAGLDGLVPILLVFGTYLWMTDKSPLSPFVVQWAEAICKTTKEVWCLYVTHQINDALRIRNGPNTLTMLDLPLQSKICVWRKKRGWSGPHQLIAING